MTGSAAKELAEWLRFLRSGSHVLTRHPRLIYTEAANQPDVTAPARAARLRQDEGRAPPWFRWVTKPKQPSAVMLTLAGHQGPVRACAVTRDGSHIASGSADGTLKFWDATSGAELLAYKGHSGPVTACAFSPDEQTLVSAGEDGTLMLWRVRSGEGLAVISERSAPVRACALSGRGNLIVSGGDDRILQLRDARTGASVRNLTGHDGEILSCTFSPDETLIASGSADKTVRLWDATSGIQLAVLGAHQGAVRACAFSPDGDRLVSGAGFVAAKAMFTFAEVMELALWDVSSIIAGKGTAPSVMRRPEWAAPGASVGGMLGLFDASVPADVATGRTANVMNQLAISPDRQLHEGGILACAFAPDGRQVLTASADATLRLWDARTLDCLGTLNGHDLAASACAWSSTGDVVVSGSDDGTVKIWNISLAASSSATPPPRKLEHVSYRLSPDGRSLATGAAIGQMLGLITLGDVESGDLLATLAGHEYCAVVNDFSPDGRMLLTSAILRGPPLLWDLPARKRAATLGPQGEVTHCVFSPDGSLILVAESTLSLWDAGTHREMGKLAGQPPVTAICGFSPDGEIVAAVGSDDCLRIWDTDSGALKQTWSGVKGWFAFSPVGTRILCAGSDETLRLRDRETGGELAVVRDATVPCGFAPDGSRVVAASTDHSLAIHDAEKGARIARLVGHTNRITSCAFSPDGERILSSSSDQTARAWDAETGRELARYYLSAGIVAAHWRPAGDSLVLGDRAGEARLLSLENVPTGPPIVTAWHERGPPGPFGRYFGSVQFGCPRCRTWSAFSAIVMGHEHDCPHCGLTLRFNRLAVVADWRPVARAWRSAAAAVLIVP